MSSIITGFHAIEERVKSISKKKEDTTKYQLFYSKQGPRVKKILSEAQKTSIEIICVDDDRLDELVENLPEALKDHRGIVLCDNAESTKSKNLVDFDAWVKSYAQNKDKISVVILDRITDPHNIGAIIRSCDQFGVDLVIIPEHNSVKDVINNETIARTSAGSSVWVPISIVNNLVRVVEKLKEVGFWIYGADAGGESCEEVNFSDKCVLIMGSEGYGIAKLLESKCDSIISIPTCGKIDSLNVSVAAGVLLYEIFRKKRLN